MFKIADAHCDFLAYQVISQSDSRLYDHIDIEKMQRGGVALQTFAVWVPPETENKLELGFQQIQYFHDFIEKNKQDVHLCINAADFNNSHRISAILAIESGESIDCNNRCMSSLYKDGVRIFSLTWNGENAYASGCMAHGGLKLHGIKAINLLNSFNVALDVSHINEKGFWEAIDIYEHAPCATHSCVYELYEAPRNLKRNQIKALISRKGYIGINFYTEFLSGEKADIDDIVNHIEYILDCGGEDVVGFGSDFCGIQHTPKGLYSAADFQKIPEAMLRRNYKETLVTKICYGNFARYILQFLKQ